MDNQFQARIAAFAEKYQKGEEVYNALKDNRPEGMDVIISPMHIGDTIWVCIFMDAYKKKYGCDQILFVVPEYQEEFVRLFPQIDDVLGITEDEITALKVYMGFNSFWYENHIRYGFFHHEMTINSTGVYFITKVMATRDYDFMNASRKVFLGLDDDAVKNGAVEPNPPEDASKYANAVLLLPTARTQEGDVSSAFWKKLADKLKEKGYDVYCNYNNLPYEQMIEGTTPLSTKLAEIYNLSKSFKRFIGFRSGILDLIAVGHANITVLHPTYEDLPDMVVTPTTNISDNLYQLNALETLQAYQYRTSWEDELINTIVENI